MQFTFVLLKLLGATAGRGVCAPGISYEAPIGVLD